MANETVKTFDFNQDPMLMDPVTYGAYYAIRHVALAQEPVNESILPDGKIMTEAQVAELLGPTKAKGLGLTVTPGMKEPVKKSVADKEA